MFVLKLFPLQVADPDEKIRKLEELTGGTPNGIGDVEAASNVLESINISDSGTQQAISINHNMTQSIVNSVSNLVDSDLMIAEDVTEIQSASKIGERYSITDMKDSWKLPASNYNLSFLHNFQYVENASQIYLVHIVPTIFRIVNQVVNVAEMTDVKNEIINSPKVAIIDIVKDTERGQTGAPNSAGIVAFTLPEESRRNKDLQDCRVKKAASKDKTVLLVSIHVAA